MPSNDLTGAFYMGLGVAARLLGRDRTEIDLTPTLELLRSISNGDEILSNVDAYPDNPELRRAQIEAEQATAGELMRQFDEYGMSD